jgi:hypothetical protein
MPEQYLVVTDVGRVLVEINAAAGSLDADFIHVREADGLEDLPMETPLRAFASKMVDLVQVHAKSPPGVSETLLAMMVKEKAAEDLGRIERAARRFAAAAGR